MLGELASNSNLIQNSRPIGLAVIRLLLFEKCYIHSFNSISLISFIYLTFPQHSDDKLSGSHDDEEMEHKIADEIDEVLGKTSEKDPDFDIVLTEYHSDGEEPG